MPLAVKEIAQFGLAAYLNQIPQLFWPLNWTRIATLLLILVAAIFCYTINQMMGISSHKAGRSITSKNQKYRRSGA
jgi:hypothetical protein